MVGLARLVSAVAPPLMVIDGVGAGTAMVSCWVAVPVLPAGSVLAALIVTVPLPSAAGVTDHVPSACTVAESAWSAILTVTAEPWGASVVPVTGGVAEADAACAPPVIGDHRWGGVDRGDDRCGHIPDQVRVDDGPRRCGEPELVGRRGGVGHRVLQHLLEGGIGGESRVHGHRREAIRRDRHPELAGHGGRDDARIVESDVQLLRSGRQVGRCEVAVTGLARTRPAQNDRVGLESR